MNPYRVRINNLKKFISNFKRVAVAYSGGVDSSLVLKVSGDVLGKNNVVAVTGVSETYPMSDFMTAKKITGLLGVRHVMVKTTELATVSFRENSPLRCYHCKKELFSKIKRIADKYGADAVFDGSNYDDRCDFRPGRKAAEESGVLSPLLRNRITKDDVRKISRTLGLRTWDKPQMACLASRIPYGTAISKPALKRIEAAENILCNMGFRDVRVRHYGTTARLEVSKELVKNLFIPENRKSIIRKLKKLGYKYITVDLEGYRTGSMNE